MSGCCSFFCYGSSCCNRNTVTGRKGPQLIYETFIFSPFKQWKRFGVFPTMFFLHFLLVFLVLWHVYIYNGVIGGMRRVIGLNFQSSLFPDDWLAFHGDDTDDPTFVQFLMFEVGAIVDARNLLLERYWILPDIALSSVDVYATLPAIGPPTCTWKHYNADGILDPTIRPNLDILTDTANIVAPTDNYPFPPDADTNSTSAQAFFSTLVRVTYHLPLQVYDPRPDTSPFAVNGGCRAWSLDVTYDFHARQQLQVNWQFVDKGRCIGDAAGSRHMAFFIITIVTLGITFLIESIQTFETIQVLISFFRARNIQEAIIASGSMNFSVQMNEKHNTVLQELVTLAIQVRDFAVKSRIDLSLKSSIPLDVASISALLPRPPTLKNNNLQIRLNIENDARGNEKRFYFVDLGETEQQLINSYEKNLQTCISTLQNTWSSQFGIVLEDANDMTNSSTENNIGNRNEITIDRENFVSTTTTLLHRLRWFDLFKMARPLIFLRFIGSILLLIYCIVSLMNNGDTPSGTWPAPLLATSASAIIVASLVYLDFSPDAYSSALTLVRAGPRVFGFLLGAFPFFMALSLFGTIVFGRTSVRYATVHMSAITLFAFLNGDALRETYQHTEGYGWETPHASTLLTYIGDAFLCITIIFFAYIVVNSLVAIVDSAFFDTRASDPRGLIYAARRPVILIHEAITELFHEDLKRDSITVAVNTTDFKEKSTNI